MRSLVYLDDPLADMYERWDEATAKGRSWEEYHPCTNLVWLHFLLFRLTKNLRWTKPNDKTRFDEPGDSLASEMRALAKRLERIVKECRQLLEPARLLGSGLGSATDLVRLALDEGWLDVGDVTGDRAG